MVSTKKEKEVLGGALSGRPGRPQAGWLSHLAGLQPALGRVQAGPWPAASGPSPAFCVASRPGPGRLQAGDFGHPAGPGPAQAGVRPASLQPSLPAYLRQAGQAGSRPGSGRSPCTLQNAPNGSFVGKGYLYPSL